MRRTAELHPAATSHEESVLRDDAAHVCMLYPVSVSREGPREYNRAVAGHRMGYHEYVHGAYYGLKYRADQKRYRVIVLGLRLISCKIISV